MKRNLLTIMMTICLLWAGTVVDARETTVELPDFDSFQYEPLNFNATEPATETLKTDLEFWTIPDYTLPLVTLMVDINAGSSLDPAEKTGLAQMTAQTLVQGGTEKMSAEEFNRQAELFGFNFDARAGSESTQISVTCLAKDLNPAMMMLMDLIRNPGFDDKQMELVRSSQIEQLKRAEQTPFFMAFNTLSSRVYGPGHPRAIVPDADALKAITRDDLKTFHAGYYQPDISRFAVIGAAGDDEYKWLKMSLSNWKGKAKGHSETPDPQPVTDKRTIILVDRPGTQSVVAMGHKGLGPNTPLRHTLEVFNEIYGGQGLSSRLMNQVRTQKGLAYVVFGSHMFEKPEGAFIAACMTRNETVVEAIETILSVTESLKTEPVPDDELESVIQAMENSFIFKFERPRRVLQRMLVHQRLGLPDDYLATYLEKIREVTPDKIMKAARDTIHPEQLQIVVAGPVDQLKESLETLGWPIEIIDSK